MKYFLFLITIAILSSCGGTKEGEQKTGILSYLLSITDNEDKGIKAVLDFYGGYCEYSIGSSASSSEGKKKFFTLKMSESDGLENLAQVIEMPASNIAYIFYKNLKEEKSKYDEIRVKILFKNGNEIDFKYTTSQLELVVNRMELANKSVEIIRRKKFIELSPIINDSTIFKFDKKQLISNLKKFNDQFGEVTDGFRPFGFKINKKNDIDVLHIAGVIMRNKQNNEFSIDVDLNSTKDEIFRLQYKL